MKIKEGGGMDAQQQKFELAIKEAFPNSPQYLNKNPDGTYRNTTTFGAWIGWKLAAKAQAVPEWISVQDRMPEQGQKVLVFRPDAHNHPHKDPNFKICTYAGADIFINSHFEHVITHWKPLESPIEAQEPTND